MAACFVVGFQKEIFKLRHHLRLSLDVERPFEKLSRQPTGISGGG